ncbi:hypothetical protein L1987_77253 [Smallanthus sonchifolius]|uniref:Uncharacterized protein n=1 Tax=Smallanthus sonchifolius TaxID=185202 RepID=A0ACB8Z8H7_9ASTR|nr:hypothetical protein L1987_77253 [Smallanthus sonchifolius]
MYVTQSQTPPSLFTISASLNLLGQTTTARTTTTTKSASPLHHRLKSALPLRVQFTIRYQVTRAASVEAGGIGLR